MAEFKLTAEDLLAGANMLFEVAIPSNVLYPGIDGDKGETSADIAKVVQLRPLTIGTFQLIMKAARNEPGLIPLLMIKEALVQPPLSLEEIKKLHLGLIEFLISYIRQISGLTEKKSPLVT